MLIVTKNAYIAFTMLIVICVSFSYTGASTLNSKLKNIDQKIRRVQEEIKSEENSYKKAKENLHSLIKVDSDRLNHINHQATLEMEKDQTQVNKKSEILDQQMVELKQAKQENNKQALDHSQAKVQDSEKLIQGLQKVLKHHQVHFQKRSKQAELQLNKHSSHMEKIFIQHKKRDEAFTKE